MSQQNDMKDQVQLQIDKVCGNDPDCCAYGPSCPATLKVFPNGSEAFDSCGC